MPVVMSSLSTFTVCMHSRLLSFLYISLPIEHGRNDYASIYTRGITARLRVNYVRVKNARRAHLLFRDTQREFACAWRAHGVKWRWRDGANRKDRHRLAHFRAKLGMFMAILQCKLERNVACTSCGFVRTLMQFGRNCANLCALGTASIVYCF